MRTNRERVAIPESTARMRLMTAWKVVGWIVCLGGSCLWLFGYFTVGTTPLFDLKPVAPSWIADYLPNLESEIGFVAAFLGMVPIYWPSRGGHFHTTSSKA